MADKKIVYISGPITGVPNYRDKFADAADTIRARGFVVLNPAELPAGLTDKQYMRIDLAMLDCADRVVCLPGWMHSKGAEVEVYYARRVGTPTMEYDAFLREVRRL